MRITKTVQEWWKAFDALDHKEQPGPAKDTADAIKWGLGLRGSYRFDLRVVITIPDEGVGLLNNPSAHECPEAMAS